MQRRLVDLVATVFSTGSLVFGVLRSYLMQARFALSVNLARLPMLPVWGNADE